MSKYNVKGILKKLLFDRELTPTELSRQIDLPQQTIQRITTGKCKKPHEKTIKLIADYFDISPDQLTGKESLFPEQKTTDANPINVYDCEQLTQLNNSEQTIQPKQQLLANPNYAKDTFGIVMNDSSMTPYFPKGCILIIEPKQTINDRDFILVKLHDSDTHLFRQALSDGENYFLKALNADLLTFPVRKLNQQDNILGTLVESRQVYTQTLGVEQHV